MSTPVWVTEFCRTSTNKPNSQEDRKRPKSFSASVSRKDGGSGGAGGGLLFSLGSRPQPGGPAVLLLRIKVSFLVPGLWFSFCSAQVHHLGPGPPVVWESTLRLSLGRTLSSAPLHVVMGCPTPHHLLTVKGTRGSNQLSMGLSPAHLHS